MTQTPPFKADQRIGAFRVQYSHVLSDLGCIMTLACHEPSGAKVLHIGNQDPENVFCLSLATPPPDATGVSHILEHCVLCGSREYPVKDPFFSMSRRSLNTFMNAFTGADFTCYPAASQVSEDFYNLLDVYGDAVFHPRLLETSFWQEGIRLERVPRPGRGLQYGGIVFNEMKGVLAVGERRLWSQLVTHLFPDTPYKFESGGHPDHIPKLTLENLRAYHSDHYHPSRCLFYFYGNIPLEDHLSHLQKKILGNAHSRRGQKAPARQPKIDQPIYIKDLYPSGEDQLASGALFGLAWYVCDLKDRRAIWLMALLDELLLGSDAAPLKRHLIDRGLCKQVQSLLDGEIPQVPYALLLKGCSAVDPKVLEAAVLQILEEIKVRGFSPEQIEGALHRLELQHLEIESHQNPYGLSLFWRSALTCQHGADPLDALSVHEHFQELGTYVKRLPELSAQVDQRFLRNQHRVSALLQPDSELAQREQTREDCKLADLLKSLTSDEIDQLERQSQKLANAQNALEDLSCLPIVSIQSIPRSPKQFALQTTGLGTGYCHAHQTVTNGFLYLDALLPLPDLSLKRPFENLESPHLDQTALLRVLALFLSRVGAHDRDFAANASAIAAHTGGIGADIACFAPATGGGFTSYLRVRTKGLRRKSKELMTLLGDISCRANFDDKERLRELLAQHCVELEHSLTRDTLHYVLLAASSHHSQSARSMSRWQGLEYVQSMKSLWKKVQNDQSNFNRLFINPLKSLLAQLSAPEHLILTCESGDWRHLVDNRFYGFEAHFQSNSLSCSKHDHKSAATRRPLPQERAFVIPSQVANNVLSMPGTCFADSAAPHLQLAAHLLQHQTLHPCIREQGGAYGCGALPRTDWQTFALFSSRDPNIGATQTVFASAIKTLSLKGCSQRELDEAKRSAIQNLDSPIAPGDRGASEFGRQLRGQNFELRALQRKRLLDAKPSDIQKCCQTHLLPQIERASFVTAAQDSLLERAAPNIVKEEI